LLEAAASQAGTPPPSSSAPRGGGASVAKGAASARRTDTRETQTDVTQETLLDRLRAEAKEAFLADVRAGRLPQEDAESVRDAVSRGHSGHDDEDDSDDNSDGCVTAIGTRLIQPS
jgi:hypothetical protein